MYVERETKVLFEDDPQIQAEKALWGLIFSCGRKTSSGYLVEHGVCCCVAADPKPSSLRELLAVPSLLAQQVGYSAARLFVVSSAAVCRHGSGRASQSHPCVRQQGRAGSDGWDGPPGFLPCLSICLSVSCLWLFLHDGLGMMGEMRLVGASCGSSGSPQ